MIISYRLCDIPATHVPPVCKDSKRELNKLCLRSVVTAFKQLNPTMVIFADFCSREWEDIIRKEVPFPHELIFTEKGIDETARYQYEYLKDTKEDVILFQECDYVYRPSVGVQMYEAIKHFQLVSPYDHPDFYTRYDIHDRENKIEVFNNNHYRSAKRNTMTFGMTTEAFKKSYPILHKWGYLDNEVWEELRQAGYPLYTPIPAMATHMVEDLLSPAIPWEVLFKLYGN